MKQFCIKKTTLKIVLLSCFSLISCFIFIKYFIGFSHKSKAAFSRPKPLTYLQENNQSHNKVEVFLGAVKIQRNLFFNHDNWSNIVVAEEGIINDAFKKVNKLVKNYNTHIFLGTFPLDHDNIIRGDISIQMQEEIYNDSKKTYPGGHDYQTILHINNEGKIVGVKIKGSKPIGNFSLNKNGQEINILPLTCGDAYKYNSNYSNTIRGEAPDWVVDYNKQPYQIITHSWGDDGSLFMSELAKCYIQKKQRDSIYDLNFLENCFNTYYSGYLSLMTDDAVIITSGHDGHASVINKNQKKINYYIDNKDFVVAKVTFNFPL